ncbi:GNAT family N-acetyltransferase [Streptomyces hebeiensis]|uniref:GNAT family N-acetyltransferase n=1 Tax=Streptomyces hebeiensis TaxID=229486 RepID=UPI0031E1E3C5
MTAGQSVRPADAVAPVRSPAPASASASVPAPSPACPAGAVPKPVFTTELCRDTDRFAELAPAWDALHRRSRNATPFQCHAWLYSWWLSYGKRGRLRVVLVHRDGELVAAAPLMLVRGALPVLVPIGTGITDYCDVLLDEGPDGPAGPDGAAVAEALARALANAARTAVIDLREVRPGAAAERVLACWRGPRRELPDSLCLELPALTMDELLGRLATARSQRARAKMRKLDALGIQEQPVPEAEVPDAVGRLLGLHRLQWQGRGVTQEHLSARFSDHLTRAVTSMVATGTARVTEFRLEGKVVAADLTLMSGRMEGGYLYGVDPTLRDRKVDVATMLLRSAIRHIGASGRSTLSLLRGDEPYKHHWRPETVRNQRLLIARPALAPVLWLVVARAAGRSRAAALVKRLRAVDGRHGGDQQSSAKSTGKQAGARSTDRRARAEGGRAACEDKGRGKGRGRDNVRGGDNVRR